MPKFLNSKEKHLSLNTSEMVVRSTLNFVYFQSFGYEATREQVAGFFCWKKVGENRRFHIREPLFIESIYLLLIQRMIGQT